MEVSSAHSEHLSRFLSFFLPVKWDNSLTILLSEWGWGCSSVSELYPRMPKTLGLIPSTEKEERYPDI